MDLNALQGYRNDVQMKSGIAPRGSNSNYGELGKDAFLKILMTQLQNQDPMSPMEDKDFIAQMATFSNLEQMITMNKWMELVVSGQNNSYVLQFSNTIGKKVEYAEMTDQKDENGEYIVKKGEGVVKSIHYTGKDVNIELEDGTKINAFNITTIKDNVPIVKPEEGDKPGEGIKPPPTDGGDDNPTEDKEDK